MTTYTWLNDRQDEREKWELIGGPLDGQRALLSDGTTAVMWIRGFYGRYVKSRRMQGSSEWQPIPWFAQLASK